MTGSELIHLGPHSYIGPGATAHVPVEVGSYTSIAADLRIVSGQHPPVEHRGAVSTYPFAEQFGVDYWPSKMDGTVWIGHDCWIGEAVTIMEGVTVGNGAIVAAGSLVTRDVERFTVVGGHPATEIRHRFSGVLPDDGDYPGLDCRAAGRMIERIAWWLWPHERVLEAVPHMKDVRAFIAHYG